MTTPEKTLFLKILTSVLVVVMALLLYQNWQLKMQLVVPTYPQDTPGGVACTADALLCPDGSAVGRVPPACDFAPCPTTNKGDSNTQTLFEGETFTYSFSYPSYFQVEKDPYGNNNPAMERVNFTNTTLNTPIKSIEFRALKGTWANQPPAPDSVTTNNTTFWYVVYPGYSGIGLVTAMAQKDSELIFEFRFNGAKDSNDPVIQQILWSFTFTDTK